MIFFYQYLKWRKIWSFKFESLINDPEDQEQICLRAPSQNTIKWKSLGKRMENSKINTKHFLKDCFVQVSAKIVVGPALLSLMIARCPSAITIMKLWKSRDLLLTRPGNYMAHITRLRIKRKSPETWGSTFIGVNGRGLGFYGLSLYRWT